MFDRDSDNLIIDLDSEEVIIDGYNSAFEGTPFYGKEFQITICPLTHNEYDKCRKRFTNERKRKFDEVGFEKEIFKKQVVDWKSFLDPKGNDIPCNEETKEKIINKVFFFARAVNIACLNSRMEISGIEQKNLKKSGDGS